MAMLEIFKPAPQRAVHVLDDYCQGVSICPPRLAANGVPELLDTLLSGPSIATLEVVPKKVKATRYRRVHNASLLRVQAQSVASRPVLHPRKRLSRCRFRPAQNHEVI